MILAPALAFSLAPPNSPEVALPSGPEIAVVIEPIAIEPAALQGRKNSEPEPLEKPEDVGGEAIAGPSEPSPKPAQVPASAGSPDIRFRLEIDLPIMIGFAGVWAVTEGFKSRIAPQECHWCEAGRIDRRVRSALVWRDPDAAALTSDILAYAAIPALSLTLTMVAVGREREWRRIHEDLVVALEAVAISAALTNAIKLTTARTRPYAESEAIPFSEDPDQHLSFPSGHTSFAFALAGAFATVATLRKRPLAPVFWGLGMPAAALVGYLRMAGDRHWLGDVLVGASMGTLVGVGLPWLLHHPRTGVLTRRVGRDKRVNSLRIVPASVGLVVIGRL